MKILIHLENDEEVATNFDIAKEIYKLCKKDRLWNATTIAQMILLQTNQDAVDVLCGECYEVDE